VTRPRLSRLVVGTAVGFLGATAAVLQGQAGRAVASVTVTPSNASVQVGGSIALTAAALDRRGRVLAGQMFTWSSSNTALATVSGGVVTGVAVGPVSITATTGGQDGVAHVTVTPLPSVVPKPGPPGTRIGFPPPLVSLDDHHHCLLRGDGAAFCWGSNASGELGDGTTREHSMPVAAAPSLGFKTLGVGASHSCGLSMSGSIACWGDNQSQQLGSFANAMSVTAIVVTPQTFRSLSVGGYHACAVTVTGTAYCWGANDYGQLGNFSAASHAPVFVAGGRSFRSVSAGAYHTCGIDSYGAVYCWGWDDWGQLGVPPPADVCGTQPDPPGAVRIGALLVAAHCIKRPVFVPVPLLDPFSASFAMFTSVTAGYSHTCGIDTHAAVWCWGSNTSGQLGNGTVSRSGTPAAVARPMRFASVSAGRAHTCGLTPDGEALCWGDDSTGQLGDGPDLSMGVQTCPTLPDGSRPRCVPQAGNQRSLPVAVVGGLRFASVSAGGNSTCAVTTDGSVYCWGAVAGSREPVRLSGWR